MSKTLKKIIAMVVVIVAGWLLYASGALGPISKQVAKKPKTIGAIYLYQHTAAYNSLINEIKKLGYTDAKFDSVKIVPGPTFTADTENATKKMIDDHVDVIFVSLEHVAKTAIELTKKNNSNIPIVFINRFHDPVDFGNIKSYKSSGNNSTGVASNVPETVQKNLLFLKEINPNAKKVGIFTDGFMFPLELRYADIILSELKKQAPRFGLSVVEYTTKAAPPDAEKSWYQVADKIKLGEIDALFHLPGHYFPTQEIAETKLANRLHIPHYVPQEDMPNGGTFSYDDDLNILVKQAAVMIDKIFKGARPTDIPIEFGAKTILILNLQRAREAGFVFPDSMLNISEVKIDK